MGAAKWEWGIQCDCPSKPIMHNPSKTFSDSRDRRWNYKDYVCTNCSTIWRIKTNSNTNEILRGPYIPLQQQNQQTNKHDEVIPDSCYTYKPIRTELTNIINGVEYKGTCIEIKSHCKHNKKLYILIRNEISGTVNYYALGVNDCGEKIEFGERYSISFTHDSRKIENTIGQRISTWPAMPFCQ